MTVTGRIMKATGGFYYVQTNETQTLECRARGLFRKDGITPYVGDWVTVEMNPDGSGTVVDIAPRKNGLIRPPVANLDYLVLVLSVKDPAPNLLVTDKLLSVLEHRAVDVMIAVSKVDRGNAGKIQAHYSAAGYPIFLIDNHTGSGVAQLVEAMGESVCVFAGNTGVGKSSLLNAIDPRLSAPVGDTSRKLGRGRHTTRHTQIFRLPTGAMVADTPGFSTVDLLQMSDLTARDLPECFREFAPFRAKCRFDDCQHLQESGCAVRAAAEGGEIPLTRYNNYTRIYDEIKDAKEWERKK